MLRPAVLLLGALILPGGIGAPAAETWSWNTANFSVLKTSRWEASVLAIGRAGIGASTARQGRLGSIVKLRLAPRLTGFGGYYFVEDRNNAGVWKAIPRWFGGVETPVVRRKSMTVDLRTVVERYLPEDRGDYTRFRQRARVSTAKRFGPYAYVECLFLTTGFDNSRYGAGMRWLATRRSAVEFGYVFDQRRASLGPNRHVIETHLYFDRFKIER